MKPTDYPEEDSRTVPFEQDAAEAAAVRRAEAQSRYLDLPPDPEARRAGRNLALGLSCLSLAGIALWLGAIYAGLAAVVTLIGCIAIFGIAVLFHRTRVLAQRHGVLLGFGLAALLGALLPFVSGGVRKLDSYARQHLGDGQAKSVMPEQDPLPPPPNRDTVAPAPSSPEFPPALAAANPGSGPALPIAPTEPEESIEAEIYPRPARSVARSTGALPAGAPSASKKPALQTKPTGGAGGERELIIPLPAEGADKICTVKRDIQITLDGRPTLIREGTVLQFDRFEDGQVHFVANGTPVQVDLEYVKFGGPSKENAKQMEALAMQKAISRYPMLGMKDLDNNESKAMQQFRSEEALFRGDAEAKELFKTPTWPLKLADRCAEKYGWLTPDAAPGNAPAAPADPDEDIPLNERPADLPPAPTDPVEPASGALPLPKPPGGATDTPQRTAPPPLPAPADVPAARRGR